MLRSIKTVENNVVRFAWERIVSFVCDGPAELLEYVMVLYILTENEAENKVNLFRGVGEK